MKKAIGKIAVFLIPASMVALMLLFHMEVVAKYKTRITAHFPEVGVTLLSKTVESPKLSGEFVYTGEVQHPELNVPAGMSISGQIEGINAGVYEIICELDDPINDTWDDGTKEAKHLFWTIQRKPIRIPRIIENNLIYNGAAQTPAIAELDAQHVTALGITAQDAGEYSAEFSLMDRQNLVWSDGSDDTKTDRYGIYVCRIGERYYTSVTRAFSSNLSSQEIPILMLVDWSEEAVNESGTDVLDLNGFTLRSEAITVRNLGTLTVLGQGLLLAESSGSRNLSPLENTGELRVLSGEFQSVYNGELTGGAEVYGVLNNGGTVNINGGTFSVQGKALAAEAICANSGQVIVNGGTFFAVNQAKTHGAYVVWAEGGTVTVNDGDFYVENELGSLNAYGGISGRIEVCGGRTNAQSLSGVSSNVLYAQNELQIVLSGGEHSISGMGELVFAATNGSGFVQIVGGENELRQTAKGPYLVNGLLATAGRIEMSGGTLSVNSEGTQGSVAAGATYGEMALSGGEIRVVNRSNGFVYGVYTDKGAVTISGASLVLESRFGHATGVSSISAGGSIRIESGSLSLLGDTVKLGESASKSNAIALTNPAAFSTSISYQSAYSVGNFWSQEPIIGEVNRLQSASTQSYLSDASGLQETGGLSAQEDDGLKPVSRVELGQFTVAGQTLWVYLGECSEIVLNAIRNGTWRVTIERDGRTRIVLQNGEGTEQTYMQKQIEKTNGMIVVCNESCGGRLPVVGSSTMLKGTRATEKLLFGSNMSVSVPQTVNIGFAVPREESTTSVAVIQYRNADGEVVRVEFIDEP